jgi:hypothetical protein
VRGGISVSGRGSLLKGEPGESGDAWRAKRGGGGERALARRGTARAAGIGPRPVGAGGSVAA